MVTTLTAQMSDLLAPISKSTTRTQSTYTNGSVRGTLDRISERITLAFQALSRPEASAGQLSKYENLPYVSRVGAGGESVSQLPLKDKAFSTFLDQNPPFELPPKWNSAFDKTCPAQWPVIDNTAIKQLAKGKIAVAPLGLIAVPSWNLMMAHPGSGPALQFPSAVDVMKEP